MKTLYLFPRINVEYIRYPNPYMSNLEISLSRYFKIRNKTYSKIGVLDLFKYLFSTDIFYLNWIENLPQKKFGKLQTIVFFLFSSSQNALK
jgi:hypothetical protein